MEAKEYKNFSGGMADLNSPFEETAGEYVDNLDIAEENTIEQRHGSRVLDDTASLVSTSAGGVREDLRNGSIFNYEEDLHLIVRGINKLYAKNSASWTAAGAWTKIPSPNTGWEALPAPSALTASTVVSSALWAGQQIMVGRDDSQGSPNFITPQKAFLDNTNTWKVQNASLPAPSDPFGFVNYSKVLKQCFVLADLIGYRLEQHIEDDDLHWAQVPSSFPVLSGFTTTEEELIDKTVTLIDVFNQHINDSLNPSAGNAHGRDTIKVSTQNLHSYKPALSYLMPDYIRPTSAFECAPLLNRLMFCFNLHYVSFYGANPGTFAIYDVAAFFDHPNDEFWLSSVDNSSILRVGDPVFFKQSGGAMPTGLTNYTNYFVTTGTTNTNGKYGIAASYADALAGTRINFTSNGSGTIVGAAGPLNLHRGTLSSSGTVNYPYIYIEGFNVIDATNFAGIPTYPNVYPHFNNEWYTDMENMFDTYKWHIENVTAHTSTGARGFMLDPSQLNATGGIKYLEPLSTYDWQVYATVMKVHYSYNLHRKLDAGTGLHHTASSSDAVDTATTFNFADYLTEATCPNPFDSSTWTTIYDLWKDFADNFSNASGTVHFTFNYGGTRHAGTAPTTVTRVFNVVFAQKRYALLAKLNSVLYNKTKIETASTPNISDSYCVIYSVEILAQRYLYAGAYVSIGLVGETVVLDHLLVTYLKENDAIDKPRITASENLDTSNITIEVYETTNGGTNLLLTASYENNSDGTYQLLDNSDTDLTDLSVELYTTGGVVGYDTIPLSSSMVRVNDYAYYGNIAEESAATLADVTFTVGSPGLVNKTNHGFTANKEVVFWNLDSTLPGDVTAGKVYYVRNPTANSFEIAESPNGTSINISVLGPGVGTDSVGTKNLSLFPKRVRQSFPGVLTASPESFFVDVESDVVFVGRAQEFPIIVCKQGVYRIEGRFTEQGQGAMIAQKISDRVGGVSANCGITVNDILYFMGVDGFYKTDGYKVQPISGHLKNRHDTITSQDLSAFSSKNSQVQCAFDRFRNIIYWSVNDSSNNYPNQLWVLHVDKGDPARKGSFTVYNSGTQFAPTAVGYFRGQFIRGDYQGFFFKHDASYKNDQKIDRTGTGSLVANVHNKIPFRYRSMADSLGESTIRKQIYRLFSLFNNTGNLTTAIKSINDRYSAGIQALKGIRFRQEYSGLVKENRTFPTKTTASNSFQGTRCHQKQVQYEPDTVILYSSDDYARASKGAGTVTLASGSWPTPDGSLVDHVIYFEDDDYTTGYTITSITSATQLAISAGGTSLTSQKWIIKGSPKDETFALRAMILYYQGAIQQPMPPTGNNGGNT